MSDNLPTLYRNIMFGLPSDFARDAFLWATDKFTDDRAAYKAESFAREADQISRAVRPMVDAAGEPHGLTEKVADDLMAYILNRHANWRTGGNRKITYA